MNLDQEISPKTRGNYPTGGWCRKRKDCVNDGKCKDCYRENKFKAKK